MCKNIANDYVIEMDPESDRKWVKRMTTFEGAMNTDINFQNIMDDKAAEPDKPPSVDVLKIRWTCENILEDVSRFIRGSIRLSHLVIGLICFYM